MYPIDPATGVLGRDPCAFVAHAEHSGVDVSRQGGAHCHQALLAPCGRFLLVPDLGADRVVVYVVDGGSIAPHSALATAPGSGQ